MTTQKTLKQLAGKVRISSRYGENKRDADEFMHGATGWRCTLRYKGRQYSFDFFQGPAVCAEPDARGTLDCLLSDAQAGEQSFEAFCSEFGYDTDSRKAEATWKACQKAAEGMKRLLGDDYEDFLYADRND